MDFLFFHVHIGWSCRLVGDLFYHLFGVMREDGIMFIYRRYNQKTRSKEQRLYVRQQTCLVEEQGRTNPAEGILGSRQVRCIMINTSQNPFELTPSEMYFASRDFVYLQDRGIGQIDYAEVLQNSIPVLKFLDQIIGDIGLAFSTLALNFHDSNFSLSI